MDDVFEKFRQIISRELRVEADKVTLDSNFTKDLDSDSLDLVELMVVLEEEFGIKVGNEELLKIRTVEEAYKFLLEKIQEKGV